MLSPWIAFLHSYKIFIMFVTVNRSDDKRITGRHTPLPPLAHLYSLWLPVGAVVLVVVLVTYPFILQAITASLALRAMVREDLVG
jgi:hypothetical protein